MCCQNAFLAHCSWILIDLRLATGGRALYEQGSSSNMYTSTASQLPARGLNDLPQPKGHSLAEEISCYSIPYGSVGTLCHFLPTFYTVICLRWDCRTWNPRNLKSIVTGTGRHLKLNLDLLPPLYLAIFLAVIGLLGSTRLRYTLPCIVRIRLPSHPPLSYGRLRYQSWIVPLRGLLLG